MTLVLKFDSTIVSIFLFLDFPKKSIRKKYIELSALGLQIEQSKIVRNVARSTRE